MSAPVSFSLRSARAGSLMVALGTIIVIETIELHILLSQNHAWIALALTLGSISALVWLALDYAALGGAYLAIEDEWLHLHVGRRASLRLARAGIASVTRPGWRDLPESGSLGARTFANLTRPAEPNVLVKLAAPAAIVLFGGIRKQVDRIAVHADDPAAVVAAYNSSMRQPVQPELLRTGDSPR